MNNCRAVRGSTSRPHPEAKALSQRAAHSPPSERSRIARREATPAQLVTAVTRATSRAGSSRSGTGPPNVPQVWARIIRSTEPVTAGAEVDEQHHGGQVPAATQLRGEGAPDVAQRREGGDHQGHR